MKTIKVAELFAGVGGFRLALEGYRDSANSAMNMPKAGPYKTIWANQWEPPGSQNKQFAAKCYQARFGKKGFINEDIHEVLDAVEKNNLEIPDIDLVVGGFPCQDYSVAKPLSSSKGIYGKKGILWWDIFRFLELKHPKYVLLENVDRLLTSPASNRGHDFAIMLSCFAHLNYSVEWQVINSGSYGFNQRRKRAFIYAVKDNNTRTSLKELAPSVLSRAFPYIKSSPTSRLTVSKDPYKTSTDFQNSATVSPFFSHGIMQAGKIATYKIRENYTGEMGALSNVLIERKLIPPAYFISKEALPKWEYLKGAKKEQRIHKKTGFSYTYSEGSMTFPDNPNLPSRTILTGEGGSGPSRFKHVVKQGTIYRRLVPDELDQLQGFPKGWTDTGLSDNQRAFCMGNALVVGVVHKIGKEIAKEIAQEESLRDDSFLQASSSRASWHIDFSEEPISQVG